MENRIDEACRIFGALSAEQQEEVLNLILSLLQEREDQPSG